MLNFERVLVTLPLTHTANPLGTEWKKKKCIWRNCSKEIAFSEQKAFCDGKNLTCSPWNNLHFLLVTRLGFGQVRAEWVTGRDLLNFCFPDPFSMRVHYTLNTPRDLVISAFDPSTGHPDHSGKRGVWRYFYINPQLELVKMPDMGEEEQKSGQWIRMSHWNPAIWVEISSISNSPRTKSLKCLQTHSTAHQGCIRTAGTDALGSSSSSAIRTNCRITKYLKLEGTHKDHWAPLGQDRLTD